MTTVEPFDFLRSLLMRLSLIVMWLAFAVFHLTLAMLLLAAAWAWEVSPATIEATATSLLQRWRDTNLAAVVGFLGASGGLALYWYVKAWKRLYSAFAVPFLFKDIDDAFARPGALHSRDGR